MEIFIMTPLAMSMLAHFAAARSPFPDYDAEPQKKVIAEFITAKVIQPTHDPDNFIYELSDRGHAYFDMVSRTPYPEKKWIDPRAKN